MRKHYTPYVSEKTKALIKERNALKEEAAANGDKSAEKEAKKKGKEIKKALVEESNITRRILGNNWTYHPPGKQLE